MISERVAAGAEWLDKVRPGWEREIDLEFLRLSMPCNCILGQLLTLADGQVLSVDARVIVPSSFRYNPMRLTPWALADRLFPMSWLIGHGFSSESCEWNDLDEAWISLIKERFNTGNFSDLEES